jgi:hypothetical protein
MQAKNRLSIFFFKSGDFPVKPYDIKYQPGKDG